MTVRHMVALAMLMAVPSLASAQQPDSVADRIVDARINRYCHPPDSCELRGALIWDTTNVAPRYSEVMRSVGISGAVEVHFVVQPDGTVDPESIAMTSATNRAFEQVTRDAVRRWRFRVASSDRPPRPIQVAVEVIFALAMHCPAGFGGPLTSLISQGPTTRVVVTACPSRPGR